MCAPAAGIAQIASLRAGGREKGQVCGREGCCAVRVVGATGRRWPVRGGGIIRRLGGEGVWCKRGRFHPQNVCSGKS